MDAADATSAEGVGTPVEDAWEVGLRVVIKADCAARVAHGIYLNNFIRPT